MWPILAKLGSLLAKKRLLASGATLALVLAVAAQPGNLNHKLCELLSNNPVQPQLPQSTLPLY